MKILRPASDLPTEELILVIEAYSWVYFMIGFLFGLSILFVAYIGPITKGDDFVFGAAVIVLLLILLLLQFHTRTQIIPELKRRIANSG